MSQYRGQYPNNSSSGGYRRGGGSEGRGSYDRGGRSPRPSGGGSLSRGGSYGSSRGAGYGDGPVRGRSSARRSSSRDAYGSSRSSGPYSGSAPRRSSRADAYAGRERRQPASSRTRSRQGLGGYGAGPARGGRRGGPAFELPSLSTLVGAAVVVVVVVAAVVAWNTRSVDIKLNGSTMSVRVGSTLADIIKEKRLSPTAGDLVSVGGKVLAQGEGYSYSASVNGSDLAIDELDGYKAADGDDLTIGDGADRCEDYDVEIEEEQPKLEMGGDAWGNITYISQWPQVGKREVRRGKTSGETAEGDVIQETKNCVVTVHQVKPDDDSKKLIALTFDDGPAATYTEKYIEILNRYGIHATFFNLGQNIEEYPELCKKIIESGNELMSHTYQHQQLSTLESAALQSEFSSAFDTISQVAGVQTTSFRPPYGDFKESTWLKSGGLASLSVLWNLDSEDWRMPGVETIVSNSTKNAFSGSIILMHDGGGDRSQDVEALPQIIETLQSEGYTFVTVGELLKSDSSIPEDIASGYAPMPSDSVWPTEIAQ